MNSREHFAAMPPLQAILLDIDETIVTTDAGAINYFNEALALMLAERDGITPAAARDAIVSLQRRSIRGDAFFAAAHLGLSLDELLRRSRKWMDDNGFRIYPDAVAFIRAAHQAGYRLFTLTNNGVLGILVKLHGAGLAGIDGNSQFEKFYGDDALAGTKDDPRVYVRFLEKEGLDGRAVLMVGDNPVQDGLNALAGGIGFAVIVDRNQSESLYVADDGLIRVNRLDALLPLLQPRPKTQ